MAIDPFLSAVIKSFTALFIIIDPFMSLAVFLPLTQGLKEKERAKEALIAVLVALGLLLVFLFSGLLLLSLLGISFASFIVAGGIILLILGVQMLFGWEFSKRDKVHKIAAVVIGTPLLTGPGAMTTVIVLSQKFGYWPPVIASLLVLAITWLMLIFSEKIKNFFGERMIEVLSRVLGLVLVAIAAEFIKEGVINMINEFREL
ncbi:MarC family protein [Candidatus Woesearchaeota archaeon]|nr:MarC family protein [Candidatus Woesearchaeota archaeon]